MPGFTWRWPMALRSDSRYDCKAMDKQATKSTSTLSTEASGASQDAGDVRLAWGSAVHWKARWRDESLAVHLERPIGERLRLALSMVLKRTEP